MMSAMLSFPESPLLVKISFKQPPQIADQRQRFGRLRRAPSMLPCITVILWSAGASPAVHPASPLALHGWGLAFRSRAGPG